jgi:hypothetical protein
MNVSSMRGKRETIMAIAFLIRGSSVLVTS